MPHHELVVGGTGSGKSYYAQARAVGWPGPVIFWNPQDQEMDLGDWTRADRTAELELFTRTPRARINYVPSWNTDQAGQELAAIVRYLMHRSSPWPWDVLLVADECDEHAPQGRIGTPLHQVAQRGRKKRVWGLFVTQFPADLAKGVVRNCSTHTIFPSMYAARYYASYRLPGDQIEATLARAPQFSFVQWDLSRQLRGPLRVINGQVRPA